MPLYEYRCPECGNEEQRYIADMEKRYEVTCTRCGSLLELRISLSSFRLAVPFSVFDADGNLLSYKPDSEATEPPTPPEKAHWLKGHGNRVEV